MVLSSWHIGKDGERHMSAVLNHHKVMKRCAIFLLLIPLLLSGCIYGPTTSLPDGEWYCHELGIQIGSGTGMETFVETENGILRCEMGIAYSGYIIVESLEDCAEYQKWERIFCGEIVFHSDDMLLLRADDTIRHYWFFRCD